MFIILVKLFVLELQGQLCILLDNFVKELCPMEEACAF